MSPPQIPSDASVPVTAVLLAAGGSRRLGQAKQLLQWRGQPLLIQAIEQLARAGCNRIFVILGAYADQCRAACDAYTSVDSARDQSVIVAHHQNWDAGQASSLQFGLNLAHATTNCPFHLLVALCDQPLMTAVNYRLLIEAVQYEHFRVASARYPEGGGAPACFHHQCLAELNTSANDEGVKTWIRRHPSANSIAFDFGIATNDVDTAQQWLELSHEMEKPQS